MGDGTGSLGGVNRMNNLGVVRPSASICKQLQGGGGEKEEWGRDSKWAKALQVSGAGGVREGYAGPS